MREGGVRHFGHFQVFEALALRTDVKPAQAVWAHPLLGSCPQLFEVHFTQNLRSGWAKWQSAQSSLGGVSNGWSDG